MRLALLSLAIVGSVVRVLSCDNAWAKRTVGWLYLPLLLTVVSVVALYMMEPFFLVMLMAAAPLLLPLIVGCVAVATAVGYLSKCKTHST